MQKLITITLLLISFSLQAQTKSVEPLDSTGRERLRVSQFKQEYDSLRALPEMHNRDFKFARLEIVRELRFQDLNKREQLLLLEQIEDAYFRFNSGKKEIEPTALLAFMESENPVCKWSGLHEEVEEKRLIRVFKVDMKIILQIFDL